MSSKKALLYFKLLMSFIILQAFLSVHLLVTHLVPEADLPKVNNYIIWISPFIGLACLFSFCRLNKLIYLAKLENQQQLGYLNSQRHDFINHLQTIIGFIQLQKAPVAQAYAREVVGDLTMCELKGQTTDETVQALLIGITESAARRGVPVTFSLCPQELDGIPMPAPALCRLVGNLLHNAVEAVEGMETNRCQVHFSLDFRDDQWYMEVSNPGPAIPAATLDKIFDPGFSTKAKTGRGQGLSIVKNITEMYGGRLMVESNDEVGTKFTVVIPKEVPIQMSETVR